MRFSPKLLLLSVFILAVCGSAMAYAYVHFNIGVYRMPVAAMEPTIMTGESIRADLSAYETAEPQRWDLIVFRSSQIDGKTWIFRVVGLPGETIAFGSTGILIDGKPAEVPNLLSNISYRGRDVDDATADDPFTVPKQSYYVLGDNPAKANDSRYWGAVTRDSIIGRAKD